MLIMLQLMDSALYLTFCSHEVFLFRSSTAEDEVESLVVFASALAVYSICVSKNSHLQHISSQIQSDVIAWTAKIFRYLDNFHYITFICALL